MMKEKKTKKSPRAVDAVYSLLEMEAIDVMLASRGKHRLRFRLRYHKSTARQQSKT